MNSRTLPNVFLFILVSSFVLSQAQETDVTFSAKIQSETGDGIPNVFVRLQADDESEAFDSLFTDNAGSISVTLPYSIEDKYSARIEDLYRQNIIVRKLHPNVLGGTQQVYTIAYAYAGKAELYFVDIQGKVYPNNSNLAAGLYLYYLQFADGMKTSMNKILVTRSGQIAVTLINKQSTENNTLKSYSITNEGEVFNVTYIADGYITQTDTFVVSETEINADVTLNEAPSPTAAFSFSGDLAVGKPVIFDASASLSGGGESLNYAWNFGNDKQGQSVAIPHIFNEAGDYEVTLFAVGSYGAMHSVTKTVSIEAASAPTSYTGSLSANIVSESQFPLLGANISFVEDDATATTNAEGTVSITSLPVATPLHVKISQVGYVSQVMEVTIPEDTKEAHFFATLKRRNAAISLPNVEFGGSVKGTEGATVELPKQGFTKKDGQLVTGTIQASVTPVDVVIETGAFPGSFQAYDATGEDGVLLSYGVSEFHFEQNGEELQLAPGKTATITIPIYTAGAQLGDEIPLWSVNEDNGTWVQEGIGTVVSSEQSLTGLALKANVGHFSWWNCDDFDDDEPRTGLCWRTECIAGNCVRKAVGCWLSGSPDGTDVTPFNSLKSLNLTRSQIQPVFEVRGFLPLEGKTLTFPTNRDVYVEARGFDEEGNLMKGSYNVEASDTTGLFEIELLPLQAGDTLELALNDTLEGFLNADEYVHYKVDIPDNKIYRVYINQGDFPQLNGLYSVKQGNKIIGSGDISGDEHLILANPGTLLISLSGQNQNDEGNYVVGIAEAVAPIPIAINDSIYDSLTINREMVMYSITQPTKMVMVSRFTRAEGSSVSGEVTFYSPKLEEIDSDYLSNTQRYITHNLQNDSTYYFVVTSTSRAYGEYVLVTEADSTENIAYGDTITRAIEFAEDIDLFQFNAQANDFVIIEGSQPNSNLSEGKYSLLDANGNELSSADITYQGTRIINRLPLAGEYAIQVVCEINDTGSYELILSKDTLLQIPYDAFTELETETERKYYLEVQIPENKVSHFSMTSDTDYGSVDMVYQDGTEIFSNRGYNTNYSLSYTYEFAPGSYYLIIDNDQSTRLYINMLESEALILDNKNQAQLVDTLQHPKQVNVYHFAGADDDAIHAVFKEVSRSSRPYGLDVDFYRHSAPNITMTFNNNVSFSYRTHDSTLLREVTGRLFGVTDDIWDIVVHADSAGDYDMAFHWLKPNNSIVVDDDFTERPDAQTSSLHAAGYAITDNGSITIANGEYGSYLPMTIDADSVNLVGMHKDSVMLLNLLDRSVITFNSTGGSIEQMSLRLGDQNLNALSLGRSGISVDYIDIGPLDGVVEAGGGIRGGSDNGSIRNSHFHDIDRSAIDMFSADNAVISNNTFITNGGAIQASGNHITVKHNTITVSSVSQAIQIGAAQGEGGHVIDSNQITMNSTSTTTGSGILNINESGLAADTNTTYVRYNTIVSYGKYYAITGIVGNPPSQLIIENNSYTGMHSEGGKGLYLQTSRTDGTSTIIVRNNLFNGLNSFEAIQIFGADLISDGERFAVYNNSFKMAPGALQNTGYHFMELRPQWEFTDTSDIYFVNNIFEGNGFSSWAECMYDFAFYSDYNVVYNFSKYIDDKGSIIGTTNDVTTDPLFTDDALHIDAASPAIDSGTDDAGYLYLPQDDYEGITRPQGSGYDMGAYEQ